MLVLTVRASYLPNFHRQVRQQVEAQIQITQVVQMETNFSRKNLQRVIVQVQLGQVLVCKPTHTPVSTLSPGNAWSLTVAYC